MSSDMHKVSEENLETVAGGAYKYDHTHDEETFKKAGLVKKMLINAQRAEDGLPPFPVN